jgi:hypothetical protein
MPSPLAKAANRIAAFMAGPTIEPRKGARPLVNPMRIDAQYRDDRVVRPNRQYRELAESDDIIVAIRRTLRFAIGELPWQIVPDIAGIKADLQSWQTIVELNLAMPGMGLHFAPRAISMDFFTRASGALKDILREESEAAEASGDDSIENNERLRAFFENCLAAHNVVAQQHAERVNDFLDAPEPGNPATSWRAFSDRIIDDLTLYDSAAFVKNPLMSGAALGELYTLPGDQIRLYRCPDLSTPRPPAIAYDHHVNDKTISVFNSLELGYVVCNPQADGYGRSPISVLMSLVMASLYGDNYTLEFFANNNAPAGVFDLGPNVDQPERDAVETRWNNLARQGMRRIMFVSNVEGVKGFIPMPTTTNKDSEIKELQLSWANRKCAVFGLGLGDIGFNQDLHRTTAETSHASAQSRGVNSFAKILAQAINLNVVRGMMWVREDPENAANLAGTAVPVFPFSDVTFEYNYDDPADDDAQTDPQTKLLTAGVLNINEVRKHRGQPPIIGGDVHTMLSGGTLIKVADLKKLAPPAAAPAAGGGPGASPTDPPALSAPNPKGPPALPAGAPALEKLAKRLHDLVTAKES